MTALLSISIALLAGLLLSRLAKLAQLPAVTAYLVAGILIGPYDLSFSMGHPGEWQNPQVANAIDEICRKTRQAGILLGAYAEADLSRWITTRQIQYLSCINDTGALMNGFRQQLAEVKKYAK